MAIRFYDFPIGGPNDTRFGSTLYCASAQLPSNPQNIKEYAMWMPRDPNCQLETDPYGITCTCNKPGTFALMQLTRNVTEVAIFFKKISLKRRKKKATMSLQGWVLCRFDLRVQGTSLEGRGAPSIPSTL